MDKNFDKTSYNEHLMTGPGKTVNFVSGESKTKSIVSLGTSLQVICFIAHEKIFSCTNLRK